MKIKQKEFQLALVEAEMNQTKLANKLGVTKSAVNHAYLQGCRYPKMKRIADALGTSVEQIAEYEGVRK